MGQADSKWIDNFIQGYEKVVADKQSRGVMPVMVGKSPISFAGLCEIVKTMALIWPDARSPALYLGRECIRLALHGMRTNLPCHALTNKPLVESDESLQNCQWNNVIKY